jgi:AcrR family transcriptional regulator
VIRNTTVKPTRRSYSSDLRDQQAEATRARVLEALVRAMSEGLAGVSIPAVAREAGVSIPTIYRHFGSKKGLIEALGPYVASKAGLMPADIPETMAEFDAMAREMFRNLATMDQTLRAALASNLGQAARRAMLPARRAMIREVVKRLAPEVPEPDQERLASLALILMATPAFHAYQDYLGLGPDASAKLVSWAVGTLVEGARSKAVNGRHSR